MTRFFASSALVLWLVLLSVVTAYAQGNTLDEADFWARLEQTDRLLIHAVAAENSAPDITAIDKLWADVQHVRLARPANGVSMIDIDMRWITESIRGGDGATLRTVEMKVSALLIYHTRGGALPSAASQDTLSNVLKDPRFNYAEPTPTPVPQKPNNTGDFSIPAIPAGLAQILLSAIGVVAVVIVVAYFLRAAKTQPRLLEESMLSPDDPVTANNARELASNRAAASDYRSAIRYLYLASLLRLNERGVIHYNATLTNREHLAQVADRPQVLELLRKIVVTFEDAWYGYVPVNRSSYEDFHQHIEQLWQMVT